VAVTGYGQERDRSLAAEAGFDHHLVKPVDADRVRELITLHFLSAAGQATPT
jgi:CheY-like chemotaxis protein